MCTGKSNLTLQPCSVRSSVRHPEDHLFLVAHQDAPPSPARTRRHERERRPRQQQQ